jgi:hypothetical protein
MRRTPRELMIYLFSIPFAAAPFGFALIRAFQTGSDFRPLMMAFASFLGAFGVWVIGRDLGRAPHAVFGLSSLAFVNATLLAGATAYMLGATAAPGLWAVAIVFGACWAAHYAIHSLSRPRLIESRRLETQTGGHGRSFLTMMSQPGAFLPVAMSFAAIGLVLVHVAMFGVVREADEGSAAHIFQLLMIVQIPIVAFFAIKWLPRSPKNALLVLALQVVAGLAALAPVFLLKL